jgi:hypothetical protein
MSKEKEPVGPIGSLLMAQLVDELTFIETIRGTRAKLREVTEKDIQLLKRADFMKEEARAWLIDAAIRGGQNIQWRLFWVYQWMDELWEKVEV